MARTETARNLHSIAPCVLVLGLACLTLPLSGCTNGGILSQTQPSARIIPVPVILPGSGTYTGVQTITITDSIAGAVLYYTTDDSIPTANSKLYASPFSIKADTTVKAIATGVGYTSSDPVSAIFTIAAAQVAPPAFAPVPGSYVGPQPVTITDITPGAVIYYTLDGTTPDTTSTLYNGVINVTASETITAMAIAAGFGNSAPVVAIYSIHGPQAAASTFSPGPGAYSGAQTVTLSSTTQRAKIYYTLDGTTPTTASTLYTGPINVTVSETISAVAGGPDFTSSPVASASYSITPPVASAPVFQPAGGTYTSPQTVTMSDYIPNAAIYYTTDGSKPATTSSLYTGPITVSSSQTLTAIAVATGYSASAASRATYSVGTPDPSTSTAYTFKNVQIVGGGFVTGIVMHPGQQGLMYARTDVGGAYRWDVSTQQWVPLTDSLTRDQANYTGIESIGIDPADPNKLYLAAGTYADSFGVDGAILVSNDQGRTFTIVPLPFKLGANNKGRFAGERLSVDPNLGSHLYFGSRLNGLWESKDSAATWSLVSSFPVTGSSTADPASTGGVIFEAFRKSTGSAGSITPTLYVGVDDNTVSALYVSNDGGRSWAAVAGQPAGLFLNRGVIGADGNMYLSYSNNLGPADATAGSIWRYSVPSTSNPVGVWKNITPVPSFTYNAASIGYGSVTADPQRPGVIMATTLDLYTLHDDVFRSLDGGNSWIDLGGNQTRDSSLSPWVNFGQATPGIGNWLVSITIDPFDSNHVLYATGQTIWQTTNATAADYTLTSATTTTAGFAPTSWSVGARGIEETVVEALISPPSGASLLSGVRDIGGFTHSSLTASPVAGMHLNPLFFDTTGLDFAQSFPGNIVRVGNGAANQQNGAFSTDGGSTWTPFTAHAGAGAGGGSVAISADAATIVWAPTDGATAYSRDMGATWTLSSGAPPSLAVVSDRVNSKKFYLFDPISGILYGSVDGAASFVTLVTGLPRNGVLRASYAAEGDLWLATSSGLFHSSNSGATIALVTTTQESYDVAFGKPATGAAAPAIYMYGRLSGVQGVFRSIDGAATWTAVTNAAHQFGYINVIAADPKVFGRVYLGTSGRGILYADPAF